MPPLQQSKREGPLEVLGSVDNKATWQYCILLYEQNQIVDCNTGKIQAARKRDR